tara:strand:- start:105 stop:347 length:243 start_codon:yes stop_codon:yes gene_type:complete
MALALVEKLRMLVAIVCAQLLNPIGMQLLESVKLVGEVALALVEELKMLVAIVCAQLLNPIGMQLLESVKLVEELVLLQL